MFVWVRACGSRSHGLGIRRISYQRLLDSYAFGFRIVQFVWISCGFRDAVVVMIRGDSWRFEVCLVSYRSFSELRDARTTGRLTDIYTADILFDDLYICEDIVIREADPKRPKIRPKRNPSLAVSGQQRI